MTRACIRLLVLTGLVAAGSALRAAPAKPVYIGARMCGQCHDGEGMGNQFSRWLHSKHSRAWASLATPEAREIARISGIRENPLDSFTCLGCHATGADSEDWEKDETYRLEDGVQCETCHGPGSEYAEEKVMRNREAAMMAGLRMPTAQTCETCHLVKGTHVAVLSSPTVDVEKGLEEIAHPTPDNAAMGAVPVAAGGKSPRPGPKYVGSHACGKCHRGPMFGYQHNVWMRSGHARAWAALGLPRSREIAAKQGIAGDPRKAPECLKCHSTGFREGSDAFLPSFSVDEGVGCEACHGPGSEYMAEAVMRDPRAAKAAGLKAAGEETCKTCHQGAHQKPYDVRLKQIAHPSKLPETAREPRYKTPLNMALRPGSTEAYVTCSGSDTVIVVDAAARKKVAEIAVGGWPEDVAFSPDGRRAFVSNLFDDTLSVIDTAARRVVRTVPVGDEPHGVLADRQGKFIYVLNTGSEDITVLDATSVEQVKTLSASRRPWSVAQSPDGSTILVTHALSRIVPLRSPSLAEITVIDADRGVVEDRPTASEANLLMGVAWHPSGEYALTTLNRTKSLVPMTRLYQGWTITNGLGIYWRDGAIDQLLLDEPDLSFPDPTDVGITLDGRLALVTSSGANRLAVVDLARLTSLVRGCNPEERLRILPNHQGKATEFVTKHIPTGASPRGVLILPDGKTALVANSMDDSLSVIDLARLEPAGTIDLEGPKTITKARRGERLFHDAAITFRRQFTCHSCHPDGHIDGIVYDIEADGIGHSPVDNRTLRGIQDTAPFKWEGTNPSLSRQCGARLAVFFTRGTPFDPEKLSAVDHYISTILRPPNRYRPLGADLTPAQRRGRQVFERDRANDGRALSANERCVTCHPPPYYTDRRLHDVGTRERLDRQSRFDTPHLNNIYDSAPYLHNGMAATLEEIWTVYNPNDRHGVTNDMTKDQLNDLIEYLKTL